MEYIRINRENLMDACKIQLNLFPNSSAYFHYINQLDKDENNAYYLVKDKDKYIGITGVYTEGSIETTDSLWLGWFGVLPKYRSRGYGRKILEDTINHAKELAKKYPNIKFFRLYTSERDNATAQALYRSVMEYIEYYNNTDDINYDGTCLIYTISFYGDEIVPWNNKNIHLKECEIEEKEGLAFMKTFNELY